MDFGILGSTQVVEGGAELSVGGPKRRAVLALLLLDAGRPVAADRLADALWPSSAPFSAVQTVQSHVSRLRKLLGADRIQSVPGGYRLCVAADGVDARAFEADVDRGRDAVDGGDAGAAVTALERALGRWRGRAFEDAEVDDRAAGEAARLTELRAVAVEVLLDARLALGQNDLAVATAEAAVAERPLRERLWGQLMLALYRDGRQAEALRAYRRLAEILVTELGVEPGPAARDLEARILRHDATLAAGDGRAWRRSVDVPSNLPTVMTDLVGRAAEVAELDAVSRDHRLVTLTGVGGVGKTRLALAVAAGRTHDFADGTWFVDLAQVSDGSDVVRAVASVVGAKSTGESRRDDLVGFVEHRQLLLVVDNCDQVLDEVAALVGDVLARATEVHVVATSRQPLGVGGEVVRRVRTLALPPSGAPPAQVAAAPAVELFVGRARAASGEFALDASNVDDVVEICRRLDGLPLAIELAAARAGALRPSDIARRLDDRFRLLAGGRGGEQRHRTLLAAITWSYDLLTPVERSVFQRLAMFPSSFDLAAAEAVVADGAPTGVPDVDLVGALVRLVERSLVQHDGGRYRLLETLRQFGVDQMALAGDGDEVRDRCATYYAGLVERVAPGVRDSRYGATDAILVPEIDNIRATANWFARQRRWRELHRMCAAGALFLGLHIQSEALDWYRQAMDNGGCDDDQQRVDGLGARALLALNGGAFDEVEPLATDSIESARRDGLEESPWSWYCRTMLASVGGDEDRALECAERMRVVALRRDDEYAALLAAGLIVGRLAALGRTDESDALVPDLLTRAARTRNASSIATTVLCAASSYLLGRPRPHFAAGLAVLDTYAPDVGSPGPVASAWLGLFRAIALVESDVVESARLASRALREADRTSTPYAAVAAVEVLSLLCARRGLAEDADRLMAYAAAHLAHRSEQPGYDWIRQERDAALARVPTPSHACGPPNRRELRQAVQRIEHALTGAPWLPM